MWLFLIVFGVLAAAILIALKRANKLAAGSGGESSSGVADHGGPSSDNCGDGDSSSDGDGGGDGGGGDGGGGGGD